jgi:class 3 adenylate cyclase/pimeloyl-ACP methyl ester carboxylesterase
MPRTRYADADGVDIAYQVLGDESEDLLLFTGLNIPIDCMDEDPRLARFQRRLMSFGRLIRFDRRGMGLSERGSAAAPPTKEQWVQDALAVLDAVGSDRAFVIGPYFSSAEALLMAHGHPDRVSGLVIIDGAARWVPDDDYPFGIPADLVRQVTTLTTEPDALDRGLDTLRMLAPSAADDASFRAWFDRVGNLAATPAMARAILTVNGTSDVRHVLPEITVPTLVVSRVDSPVPGFGPGLGGYLAEHIPGARLVELPGADMLFFIGETATMLDEIEEFVTGARSGAGSERILATMLFTDIVGSTSRVAELGDDRWRDLLEGHDQTVRAQVTRYGGRAISTAGDGFLATFGSPTPAMDCAVAIRQALRAAGLDVRAGIHTGEVEVRGADIAGLAVHVAARIAALAGPGEVLVSEPVPHLVVGSGRVFEDRGLHELRGVPGQWRVHALAG